MSAYDFAVQGTTPLVPYNTGSWDSGGLGNPDVVWDTIGNRWLMSYSGYNSTAQVWSLGLAYATNLAGPWTREAANPVMTPQAGTEYICCNGSVVPKGSTYYHFFNGYLSGGSNAYFKLATSSDGITWTRSGSNPLITYLADPFVRLDPDGVTFRCYGLNSSRQPVACTSTDGVTWTSPVAALPGQLAVTGYTRNYGEPSVVRGAGSDLHAFCDGGAVSGGGRRLHRCYSPDGGSSWTTRPNVLAPDGSSSWYTQGVFDSCPVYVAGSGGQPDRLYLFFAGSTNTNPTDNTNAGIGLAIATLKSGYL